MFNAERCIFYALGIERYAFSILRCGSTGKCAGKNKAQNPDSKFLVKGMPYKRADAAI